MLDLNAPRWAELEHAYGNASELPLWLDDLLSSERYGSDPHDVLFGCLCHQGSIYSATYAAVPHCVAALDTQAMSGKVWLFTFIGQVSISRDAQPIPSDLEEAYVAALNTAKTSVLNAAMRSAVPLNDYIHLLAAVPAIYGDEVTHRIVDLMLEAGEVSALCCHCSEECRISSTTLPFKAQHVPQHPRLTPKHGTPGSIGIHEVAHGAEFEVSPTTSHDAYWDGTIRNDNAYSWLIELAHRAGHSELVGKVQALFGTLDCPFCRQRIQLWDAACAKQRSRGT